MEYDNDTLFKLLTALGIVLAMGWLGVLLLAGAWARIWAWIDDAQGAALNPIIKKVMSWRGYSPGTGAVYKYTKQSAESRPYWNTTDGDDGIWVIVAPVCILVFLPNAMFIAFLAWPLTLILALGYLLARLARFARRHKKLFDKHIKDPEAHK